MRNLLGTIPWLFLPLCAVHAQSTYDARVVAQVGIDYACDGLTHPTLKIRNEGTSPMIGCVVETWKNSVFDNSFNWELAVSALTGQSRTPQFPPISAVEGDQIELRIISVNGVPDEVQDGNIYTYTVQAPPVEAAEVLVMVEVLTDDFPEETSWAIRDAAYQAVATSPSYTEAATTMQTPVYLLPDACYWFEVMDSFGNGIGAGAHVKLTCQGTEIIGVVSGDGFELVGDGFTTTGGNAISELAGGTSVTVHPVPANGQLFITAPERLAAVRLYDPEARMVATWINLGATVACISVADLDPGQYVLKVTDTKGGIQFRRVLVVR